MRQAKNLAVGTLDDGFQDERRARLRVMADQITPLALAREQTIPVHPVLTSLFPGAALRRGSVISVAGPGATLLALTLAAGPSQVGSWVAMVGGREIGMVAAEEVGVVLKRVLVVDPPKQAWSSTVAALVGAVDVVLISPTHRVSDADARRLVVRLRERGSVLILVESAWHAGVDVQLTIAASAWSGLGIGHGLLRSRRVTVNGSGRGAAGRPRSLDLWLPGPSGAPAAAL